jgi:hypothetical protein
VRNERAGSERLEKSDLGSLLPGQMTHKVRDKHRAPSSAHLDRAGLKLAPTPWSRLWEVSGVTGKIALINTLVLGSSRRIQARCKDYSKSNSKVY